jgi:hypothetical protein
VERAVPMCGNERFSDRERRAAVRQADLNDRLDLFGDYEVPQEIAVPFGQRYPLEVAFVVASPARTIANQSTALSLDSISDMLPVGSVSWPDVHCSPILGSSGRIYGLVLDDDDVSTVSVFDAGALISSLVVGNSMWFANLSNSGRSSGQHVRASVRPARSTYSLPPDLVICLAKLDCHEFRPKSSQGLGPIWDLTSGLPANEAHVAYLDEHQSEAVDQARPVLPGSLRSRVGAGHGGDQVV